MSARVSILLLLLALLWQTGWAQPQEGVSQPQEGASPPTAWQKTALDSVATVEFPDSVSRHETKGGASYTSSAGQTLFIAVVTPTNALVKMLGNNNKDLYDGLVKGWLQEIGGTLQHRDTVRVGAFTGVEIQFTTPRKPELPATKYTRMVLVNGTAYFLNYWTNAEQDAASATERDRFFSSFRVKARPHDLQGDAFYKMGRAFGHLLGYFLLVVVAIGLVLGGRWLLRRRNSST